VIQVELRLRQVVGGGKKSTSPGMGATGFSGGEFLSKFPALEAIPAFHAVQIPTTDFYHTY
jgi:hypothetical protein